MTDPYSSYSEWKEWLPDEFGHYSRAESVYFEAELRRSGVGTLRGLVVLEIGYGNGGFAGWARDHDATYIGVEAVSDLIDAGRTEGFDVFSSFVELEQSVAAESVDLIVAFDVFEHMSSDELCAVLVDMRAFLCAGGVLLARVPSGDSPFARSIQHGDLTHRLTIGSSMVRQLSAMAGLEVSAIRVPAFPLLGMGALACLRRTTVAAAQAVLYPFVRRLLMGGRAAVLTPTLVFVLEKRPF